MLKRDAEPSFNTYTRSILSFSSSSPSLRLYRRCVHRIMTALRAGCNAD